MLVYGDCWSCGTLFGFHPEHVPSLPIDGIREPICRDCINLANNVRTGQGLEPIWIHPDAYAPQEVQ